MTNRSAEHLYHKDDDIVRHLWKHKSCVANSVTYKLNSLYGGIANEHFNYFDINIAEGITLSGQLAIMWAEKTINKYMNNLFKTKDEDYVAYMDTDSLYVSLERLIEEINPDNPIDFIDQVCSQKLEKVLEKGYKELFDKTNGFENRMVMKREAIADKGIWCCRPDTNIVVNGETITIESFFNQFDGDTHIKDVSGKSFLIESFDDDTQNFEKDKIELCLRKPFKGEMYELTQNGKSVHVTGEHLILTRNKDTGLFTDWVKAKNLTEEDEVLLN